LQVDPWPGAALRLALLVVSASCVLAVLALMPRLAIPGTPGRRSLTAYLLHGFLVRALVAAGAFAWLAHALPDPAEVLACLVAAVLIAAALSTRMADSLAAPLTRPVDWMRDAARRGPRAIRRRMEEFKRLY
jgi:fucose 4-O-acetylase-like acetyltransferase